NIVYREPYGAVKTGTDVFLRIKVNTLDIEDVDLRIWDGAGEVVIPMLKVNEFFECKFKASESAKNLWYYFVIHYFGGEIKYYGNNEKHLGGIGEIYDVEPPSYQITVYDKDYVVPAWYSKTITYQIFVDRFFNSGRKKVYNDTQIYHKNWEEKPIKNNLNNDYFGGDLEGIIEKLPYLKMLNVGAIYLNPIFEANSNHKYNTKDFKQIDMHYGDESTFKRLCKKAKEAGIRIILDGVFNHVGNDSQYFARAISDENSPYYSWFNFTTYPSKYESWWGIRTLPTLNKSCETLKNYLFRDDDSVIKKWLKLGASGWRLDVVDELPQKFVETLRENAKKIKKDAVIIGEVWEDASNKVSYSIPRRYFLGDELDGVMNYPLKNALINFIMGGISAELFSSIFESLKENYPQTSLYTSMNILGGHDIVRPKT
ncbi:glycoside hydrolase family 13 protein, partial [Treponema sp. R6D11]